MIFILTLFLFAFFVSFAVQSCFFSRVVTAFVDGSGASDV